MGLINVGVPQVANRAVIPLAIQAGIADMIKTMIPVATNKLSLLEAVTAELEKAFAGGPPHAALNMVVFQEVLSRIQPGQVYSAINLDVLDKLLEYLATDPTSPVTLAAQLPPTVNEDGPSAVTATRAAPDSTTVNVVFSAPPSGYSYELYLDLLRVKAGNLPPEGDGMVHETLTVPVGSVLHSIRVLYVTPAGCLTKFGAIATFL